MTIRDEFERVGWDDHFDAPARHHKKVWLALDQLPKFAEAVEKSPCGCDVAEPETGFLCTRCALLKDLRAGLDQIGGNGGGG